MPRDRGPHPFAEKRRTMETIPCSELSPPSMSPASGAHTRPGHQEVDHQQLDRSRHQGEHACVNAHLCDIDSRLVANLTAMRRLIALMVVIAVASIGSAVTTLGILVVELV